MIQFTKSIELIQTENFTPQMGTFTLLDGLITDEQGVTYIRLQFELLQNHQSGNQTVRRGNVNVPKSALDSLGITYDNQITNGQACKELLRNFNINDLND